MTWSYSGDPAASDLDEVRFHLQDTVPTDQLLSDEEIQYIIDQWANYVGSNLWAAAMCAETIAAKFAREVSLSADGVSAGVEQLQEKYERLAQSLRDQHKTYAGAGAETTAGGTLFDETWDSTIAPLSFGREMHDNSRAGIQEYGGQKQATWEYPEAMDWP